ncbi:MAG: DegT/DnrJ/EryC1/StrS family aminotransferase [Candidatus Omnitrophica bacterium]|nr:DegT/DnrJ/EryC1/StrS family aminotransferase [Candidatus Omnitrophota bacterium]
MEFIPVANTYIGNEEAQAVYDVVKSGWISMGKKVQEFENMVAGYTGVKYAVAMNNGTSTLHSLLIALGVGPGDEVIVPTLTYVSSANVILYLGATPVLCESDPVTFNVEPKHIKEKITKKTKAFMTVDMKGLPVDFDAFVQLSKETKVPFLSDSAESLGAIYKGKKVGSQAWAHSFSFFANKNITTGEGGMITTNDEDLYKKLLIIRNQGQEGRYNHTWLGNNFRMPDILAAFGIEQFKRVEWLMEEKSKLADYFTKNFAKHEGIITPLVPDYVGRPSWYMYSIKVDLDKRDGLLDFLKEKNIDTRLSFPPVHIQPYYKQKFGYKANDFPISYDTFCKFVDIPIWVGMGQDKQDYIIENITSYIVKEISV